MSFCFDVEEFINEIKKYPAIWDLTCEDYRHQMRKQRAWAEVARLFIDDFDDMDEVDKSEVFRKLFNKWRNIRDSFVRHMKRPDGKKGYMYAKNLTFLKTIYKITSGSEPDAENDLNDSNSNFQWESEDDQKLKKPKKRRLLVFNEHSNWSDEDPPSTIDNLKRKRIPNVVMKTENVEFVDTPPLTDSFSMEDEDRSFFESLLPAVRQFDIDEKLEFRSQVISLVRNIRTTTHKIDTNHVATNS